MLQTTGEEHRNIEPRNFLKSDRVIFQLQTNLPGYLTAFGLQQSDAGSPPLLPDQDTQARKNEGRISPHSSG